MMMLRTVELAFARFQATRDARALAIVFDRTAKELLRVAQHVAPAPSEAEDLVQATFLTAIEAADSHERGKPVLPWLLGILANHARSARRRQRREPDLQRLRGDVIADVHAEVEAADVRRELAAAIAKLPDAYRPVLRLWFEHGLEAHEIATALERPAGTVRAQISRGMDALRRLLPAGLAGGAAVTIAAGNGLAAVRTKVLASSAATSGFASSVAIGGLLVLHHKLLAGGAALAAAFVLWFVNAPPVTPPAGNAGTGARDDVAIATSRAGDGQQRPLVERQEVARADASPPTPPADPAAPANGTVLLVRLRSAESGEPLPGLGVAALPWTGSSGSTPPSAFRPTDEHGSVRFDALKPGSWSVDVDRLGQASFVQLVEGVVNECTIDVPAALRADGTVVDASDQPVAGAAIVLHASRCASPQVAVTDALGRFHVAHVTSGVELQARKPGHAPSPAHVVQGQPGSSVSLTLRLGAGGRRILGDVLDAEGRPAAEAAVAVLPAAARQIAPWERGAPQARALWLVADGDGRFATDEVAPNEYIVVASFADRSVTPACAEADTRITDAHVTLRSDAPAVIEGSVRRDGQAIAGLTLTVFTERCDVAIGHLQHLLGLRLGGCDENGSFRIAGVLPGEVVIRAVHVTQVLGEVRRTIAAGETTRWDLDVGSGGKLTIRVAGPSALPKDMIAFVHDRISQQPAPSYVRFDAAGVGELDGPRTGPVDVILVTTLAPNSIVQLARRDAVEAGVREIHFELRDEQLPVRTLRGRCVDAVSAPLSGVKVRAQRTDAQLLVVLLETTTAADGTFAIGPLPAGRYSLSTGPLTAQVPIGEALLTSARDEAVGDLVLRDR